MSSESSIIRDPFIIMPNTFVVVGSGNSIFSVSHLAFYQAKSTMFPMSLYFSVVAFMIYRTRSVSVMSV